MNTQGSDAFDVTRTTLAVLCISMLILASFWLVRPFLTPFLWATTIVVATWPLLLALQNWLWGKRRLAVAVMIVVLLMIFVVPILLAVVAIIDKADDIIAWVRSLSSLRAPPPPRWLASIPLVGAKLAAYWQRLMILSPEDLSVWLAPYTTQAVRWFVSQAGGAGVIMLEFLLTVLIATILYAKGDTAANGVRAFARRLAGQKGEATTVLAAMTVRGVALSIALTAILQSLLGGIGLAIAGVPAAAVLTAVMFILCVAQLGPGLVLMPSIIVLYWRGDALWGTVLLVWSLPIGILDNILRPVLIRKGADLPLLLIFVGVIGGLITFGIIGLFIGPVVLAVTFTLLQAWIEGDEGQQELEHPDRT